MYNKYAPDVNPEWRWHESPVDRSEGYEALPGEEWYRNGYYQVFITPCGDMLHLSIKTHDRSHIRDWRDLQQIKNDLVGPEHEGLELFPAESRLVDTANQYHLGVLRQEGVKGPTGFNDGRVVSNHVEGNARQRPSAAFVEEDKKQDKPRGDVLLDPMDVPF